MVEEAVAAAAGVSDDEASFCGNGCGCRQRGVPCTNACSCGNSCCNRTAVQSGAGPSDLRWVTKQVFSAILSFAEPLELRPQNEAEAIAASMAACARAARLWNIPLRIMRAWWKYGRMGESRPLAFALLSDRPRTLAVISERVAVWLRTPELRADMRELLLCLVGLPLSVAIESSVTSRYTNISEHAIVSAPKALHTIALLEAKRVYKLLAASEGRHADGVALIVAKEVVLVLQARGNACVQLEPQVISSRPVFLEPRGAEELLGYRIERKLRAIVAARYGDGVAAVTVLACAHAAGIAAFRLLLAPWVAACGADKVTGRAHGGSRHIACVQLMLTASKLRQDALSEWGAGEAGAQPQADLARGDAVAQQRAQADAPEDDNMSVEHVGIRAVRVSSWPVTLRPLQPPRWPVVVGGPAQAAPAQADLAIAEVVPGAAELAQRARERGRAAAAARAQPRPEALDRTIRPSHLWQGGVGPSFDDRRVHAVRLESAIFKEMLRDEPGDDELPITAAIRAGALHGGDAALLLGSVVVAPGSVKVTLAARMGGAARAWRAAARVRPEAPSAAPAAAAAAEEAVLGIITTRVTPGAAEALAQAVSAPTATGAPPAATTAILELLRSRTLLFSGSWALQWALERGDILPPGALVSAVVRNAAPGDVDATAPLSRRTQVTDKLVTAGFQKGRDETWAMRVGAAVPAALVLGGLTEFKAAGGSLSLQVAWSGPQAGAVSFSAADAAHKSLGMDMDLNTLVITGVEGAPDDLALAYDPQLLSAIATGTATISPLRLLECCAELGDEPSAITGALRAVVTMSEHSRNLGWLASVGARVVPLPPSLLARIKLQRLFRRLVTAAVGRVPTGSSLLHVLRRTGDRALTGVRVDAPRSVARLNLLLNGAAADRLRAWSGSSARRLSCDPYADALRAALPAGALVAVLDTGISLPFDGFLGEIVGEGGNVHVEHISRIRIGTELLQDARGEHNLRRATDDLLYGWGARAEPVDAAPIANAALARADAAPAGAVYQRLRELRLTVQQRLRVTAASAAVSAAANPALPAVDGMVMRAAARAEALSAGAALQHAQDAAAAGDVQERRTWDATMVAHERARVQEAQERAGPGRRGDAERLGGGMPARWAQSTERYTPGDGAPAGSRQSLDATAAARAPLLAAHTSFGAAMGGAHFTRFGAEAQADSLLVAAINSALAAMPPLGNGRQRTLWRRNGVQAEAQRRNGYERATLVLVVGVDWMTGFTQTSAAARQLEELLLSFDVRVFAQSEPYTSCHCRACFGCLDRRGPRLPMPVGAPEGARSARAGHTAQCLHTGCGSSQHHDFAASGWQRQVLEELLNGRGRPAVLTPGGLASGPRWHSVSR